MANLNVIDTLVTRLQFQGAAEFSRQILGLGKNFDHLEEKLAKAKVALANVGDAPSLKNLDARLQKAQKAVQFAGTGPKFDNLNKDIQATKAALSQLDLGAGFDKPQQNLGAAHQKFIALRKEIQAGNVSPKIVNDYLAQPEKIIEAETALGNARLAERVKLSTRLNGLQNAQSAAEVADFNAKNSAKLALEAQYNAKYLAMEAERNAAVLAAEEELAAARAALARQLLIGGTILGAMALVAADTAAIKAAVSFETLRVELETLYKSAEKGDQAFEWAKNFAVKTPFQIEDTVKALKFMVADGINPTEQRMRDLGGMSKIFERDFSDAVKAVAQGAQGHFRRLQDSFGGINKDLVNRIAGKEIFDQAGHSIRSYSETVEAIMKTIHSKYGGAIKELEGTTAVSLSNMKDAWRNLLATIGSSQLDSVKVIADAITDGLKAMTSAAYEAQIGWTYFAEAIQMVYIGFLKLQTVNPMHFATDAWNRLRGNPTLNDQLKGADARLKDLENSRNKAGAAYDSYKQGGILPPISERPGGGNENNQMERLIQAVIGGGEIAQRGIKATEMPGATLRYNDHTYRVRLEGEGGQKLEGAVVALFEQFLNQIARGGGFHPPANAYGAP